jgi:hypothetical protein
MSFFGAMRLYVVSATLIERDLAPAGGAPLPPVVDGAWALWASNGNSGRPTDPPHLVSRVEPGPVPSGGDTDAPPPVSRVEPGPVHIARWWSDPT